MKIRDKKIKEWVDVAEKDCLDKKCYWPRKDPGSFTQGVGYQTRPGKREWLCGTREIHGCPRSDDEGKKIEKVKGADQDEPDT